MARLCENLQWKCCRAGGAPWPRRPSCASLQSRNAHGHLRRELLCGSEKAALQRAYLYLTPAINTYRKKQSHHVSCPVEALPAPHSRSDAASNCQVLEALQPTKKRHWSSKKREMRNANHDHIDSGRMQPSLGRFGIRFVHGIDQEMSGHKLSPRCSIFQPFHTSVWWHPDLGRGSHSIMTELISIFPPWLRIN